MFPYQSSINYFTWRLIRAIIIINAETKILSINFSLLPVMFQVRNFTQYWFEKRIAKNDATQLQVIQQSQDPR